MSQSYKIKEMEESLKKAKKPILLEICNQFHDFFDTTFIDDKTIKENSKIEIYELKPQDDSSLQSIYASEGFYIILTNHTIEGNDCKLQLNKEFTAIYRGECSSVKRRIESHLFNAKYDHNYSERKKLAKSEKKKFSESYFGACIKIDPEVSGINIDAEPYLGSKWWVIVLKMGGSTSPIRKQAEIAFDKKFHHPVASRD